MMTDVMTQKSKPEPAELVISEDIRRREAPAPELPAVGTWYWVVDEEEKDHQPWLGCVVHQGSNYVELHGPAGSHSTHTIRIHADGIAKYLKIEPDAERVIAGRIDEQRGIISGLTDELRLLMNRLALRLRASDSETRAIAIALPGSADDYKQALIRAKDKTVPEIQKKIREASEKMATWMQANMIPLKASIDQLDGETDVIKKRIFGVELYAGLVEQVACIAEGMPAKPCEPIRLFQRRHYMDEECLVDYDAGGMRFESLGEFDKWLLRPRNLGRILPYPRCLVAFQVRRKDWDEHERKQSFQDFVRMLFGDGSKPDEYTYLYMRNGDNVYRLRTGIEFGEKLFPDADRSILHAGSLYAIMHWNHVERLATEGEYIETKRLEAEERKQIRKMPKKERWKFNSKVRYPTKDWVAWNDRSVYYDDISKHVAGQLEDHNRLALVLQGILDRSEIFHPHPSWKLWVPDDFGRAVALIFDESRALVSGDPPSFAAYQSTLNASLGKGSHTVGQDDHWQRIEAERENERERHRYRPYRSQGYYEHRDWIRYKPDGNPGPGVFAEAAGFSLGKGCAYTWFRERMRRPQWGEAAMLRCRLVVPSSELLNLDAYTKGDYHKFYDDPRTRADYLKWAPLLLPAEEWVAGGREEFEEARREAAGEDDDDAPQASRRGRRA
jgi:hypothetical protein